MWDAYNKEKWKDGGSKLIRVRSKAQVERGVQKRERETTEIKFLLQLIRGRAKVKWSKTVGEYSMGFKVQTNSEQMGVPLENSNNRGASPN